MEEREECQDPCEIWKNITEVYTEIAEKVLGRKDKNTKSQSKTVKDLSETKKK